MDTDEMNDTMNDDTDLARCPDCRRGWAHCHELLVLHADGTYACGAGCAGGPELHAWRGSCDESACILGCGAELVAPAPALACAA